MSGLIAARARLITKKEFDSHIICRNLSNGTDSCEAIIGSIENYKVKEEIVKQANYTYA